MACDNGLGHMRRVAAVRHELARQGADVTVMARQDLAARFGVRAVHFETCTSAESFRCGDERAIHWHTRLPNLDSFDVVVSDNLPEVLHLRIDAVLMGSFLWHLVIEGTQEEYVRSVRQLLAARRPVMIGTALFASDELRNVTRFHDAGLFCRPPVFPREGKDLLISCGRSGLCEDAVKEGVAELLKRGRGPFEAIHVEPTLVPPNAPPWMLKADFGARMYARLRAAVVRPGVGTLTELIQAGCPAFCFYEDGNREMSGNAARIESAGLGFDCSSVEHAIDRAFAHGEHPQKVSRLPQASFGGAARAASLILSYAKP